MVGYVNVEEQVDADFSHARRKALLRRLAARPRRDSNLVTLPCFGEVSTRLGARGGVRRGRRVVRLSDIVGSVGRCSDFDGAFSPTKANVEERWKRVVRIFHRGEEFPPVSLYEIGGSYFVVDGNHRVSVAHYHGVEWMDADVTEFRAPSVTPSTPEPARPRTFEETKEHPRPSEPPERGDTKMHGSMMDFEIWKQRREEMLREAQQNRLAKALRHSRKRRGAGWAPGLAWELKRIAGRLLKLLRASRKVG